MKNILNKLHLIMSDCDFIAKDKTNEFHKYNYASEQAIKEKMHPLLMKHKVIFSLSTEKITRVGTITDIEFNYKFFDIESGECLDGKFIGTGEDKLDKGTYKAITGAIKYILTSTFLIPTGDDPEKESKPQQKAEYHKSHVSITEGPIPLDHLILCNNGHKRKYIPAGVTKPKTLVDGTIQPGKPYAAFYSCSDRNCSEKSISSEDIDQYLKPEFKNPKPIKI